MFLSGGSQVNIVMMIIGADKNTLYSSSAECAAAQWESEPTHSSLSLLTDYHYHRHIMRMIWFVCCHITSQWSQLEASDWPILTPKCELIIISVSIVIGCRLLMIFFPSFITCTSSPSPSSPAASPYLGRIFISQSIIRNTMAPWQSHSDWLSVED